jgi:hypothetical protein
MAPDEVTNGDSFSAEVNISYVENFDAANYDIVYNASVLNVTGVSDGAIDGTTIPVDSWDFIPGGVQGVVRIINNVGGAPGVDGRGNLSWINFNVVGNVCDSSGLVFDVSECYLSDNSANNISATWVNESVHVASP